MKIQLDDKHFLNSDPYCYWITCVVKSKEGKPYEKRVSGYAAIFGDAVNSFIENLKCEVMEWRCNIEFD